MEGLNVNCGSSHANYQNKLNSHDRRIVKFSVRFVWEQVNE